ncbi:MAG: DUF1501 domain-containing protein [Acidimicrobiia bacterium]|nr:DUF1501 domain-containing protein [Acidimicrobiia bacterium]
MASNSDNPVLVHLFMRGGMDSISALVPAGDPNYRTARPTSSIPEDKLIQIDQTFGFHPAMAGLAELYSAGELAIVHGLANPSEVRSHFDAQDDVDRGWPGNTSELTGWMARTANAMTPREIPAFAIGKMMPRSLWGLPSAVAVPSLFGFRIRDLSQQNSPLAAAFSTMYTLDEPDVAAAQGQRTLALLQRFGTINGSADTPERYGGSDIGHDLWQVAQLLNSDLDVGLVAVDHNGWDLHAQMGFWNEGRMQTQINHLSTALTAFWADIEAKRDSVVVVCESEFGRRIVENNSQGTDHGDASVGLILGTSVNGGRSFGQWPGLDLDPTAGIARTTDFRSVLSSALVNHLGLGSAIETILPEFSQSEDPVAQLFATA